MTLLRNIRGHIKAKFGASILLGPAVAGLLSLASGAHAATLADLLSLAEVGLTERVVIDRYSGFAISGFDPVAYYAAGGAVPGVAKYEVTWNGAAWRFANEGNRAAFQASPTSYAPGFGGYDAEAMARGIATAGDPKIFAVLDGRLYLFRDAASRAGFLASADMPARADKAWLTVRARLVE